MSLTSKENLVQALKWSRNEIKSLRQANERITTELYAYRRVLSAVENAAPDKRSEMNTRGDDEMFILQDTIKELENELLGDKK